MDRNKGGEDVRRSAESTVETITEQAQQTAEAHVSTQKDQAASALHSVAEAVRQSGDQLRQEQPQLASLANQAADRVDSASDYIRQHDVRDFVHSAEDFARREPLIFLGGAFAIGLIAARFLKASSPSRDSAGQRGYRYDAGSDARLSGYRGQGGGFGASYGRVGYPIQGGGYGQASGYDARAQEQRERSLGSADTARERDTQTVGVAESSQQAVGDTSSRRTGV
jgi:ElaB/YqjD/DUF883 family membrane-anchored ribosome-binding protein